MLPLSIFDIAEFRVMPELYSIHGSIGPTCLFQRIQTHYTVLLQLSLFTFGKGSVPVKS